MSTATKATHNSNTFSDIMTETKKRTETLKEHIPFLSYYFFDKGNVCSLTIDVDLKDKTEAYHLHKEEKEFDEFSWEGISHSTEKFYKVKLILAQKVIKVERQAAGRPTFLLYAEKGKKWTQLLQDKKSLGVMCTHDLYRFESEYDDDEERYNDERCLGIDDGDEFSRMINQMAKRETEKEDDDIEKEQSS